MYTIRKRTKMKPIEIKDKIKEELIKSFKKVESNPEDGLKLAINKALSGYNEYSFEVLPKEQDYLEEIIGVELLSFNSIDGNGDGHTALYVKEDELNNLPEIEEVMEHIEKTFDIEVPEVIKEREKEKHKTITKNILSGFRNLLSPKANRGQKNR